MKQIELTQGKFALIDDDDFEKINKFKWCVSSTGKKRKIYAVSRINNKSGQKTLSMSRFLMNCPKGLQIDHINHNTLDNRKFNLRICTLKQNVQYRKGHGKSGYKGVYFSIPDKKWCAMIGHDNTKTNLGLFKNKEDAAIAYNKAALKYQGEFAYLNCIKGGE